MRFAEAVLQAEMQINCRKVRSAGDGKDPDARVP